MDTCNLQHNADFRNHFHLAHLLCRGGLAVEVIFKKKYVFVEKFFLSRDPRKVSKNKIRQPAEKKRKLQNANGKKSHMCLLDSQHRKSYKLKRAETAWRVEHKSL